MIAWVDTETTGLDPERGDLLEVAIVVTSDDLDEVAKVVVVVHPITDLDIEAWSEHLIPIIREMHGKSGLLAEIVAGRGMPRRDAEAALCTWIDAVSIAWQFEPKKTQIAGSTVGFDRAWLRRHMSTFESLFHYRSIDVSSLTELAARWSSAVYEGRPKAASTHRALADVRESIALLRYYRECGFVGGGAFIGLPRVPARKSDPAVTFQPYTIDCSYCRTEHHHGSAGQRRADCDIGEYIVEIGGGK